MNENKDDELRMTGDYAPPIEERSFEEIMYYISTLGIEDNLKKLLYIAAFRAPIALYNNKMKSTSISMLKIISKYGIDYVTYESNLIFNDIIQDLKKLSNEEISELAQTLITKINNNEIELWDEKH